MAYPALRLNSEHCRSALAVLGYQPADLEHLRWDRLLHEELRSSGKQVLVEKSPCNADIIDELQRCWPDARFIVLLRDPLQVVRSMPNSFPDYDLPVASRKLAQLDDVLRRLRDRPDGALIVRYEDLLADPPRTLRQICDYLRLGYEEEMLTTAVRTTVRWSMASATGATGSAPESSSPSPARRTRPRCPTSRRSANVGATAGE